MPLREIILVGAGKVWNLLRGIELKVLVAVIVLLGCLWVLAEVSDEVLEGEAQPVDERVLLALREEGDLSQPRGPEWLNEVARDVTSLGGYAILIWTVTTVCGFLFISGRLRHALLLLAASLGALVLNMTLKSIFDRPRPTIVPALIEVGQASYPSGHAMASTAVYVTIAAVIASQSRRLREKLYLLGAGILLSMAIGLTRVYLGVHYPTDVLGGWAAGMAWATVCWIAARWLARDQRPLLDAD